MPLQLLILSVIKSIAYMIPHKLSWEYDVQSTQELLYGVRNLAWVCATSLRRCKVHRLLPRGGGGGGGGGGGRCADPAHANIKNIGGEGVSTLSTRSRRAWSEPPMPPKSEDENVFSN